MNIGDGLSSEAIEQNPDIAIIQSQLQGIPTALSQITIPATGFVSSLNGQAGSINIQAGSSTSGVTVNITNGAGTISIGVSIPVLTTIVKNNFAAIIAPTVNDDSGDGYAVGSQWVDTVLGNAFICVDATLGAAVWKQTTV